MLPFDRVTAPGQTAKVVGGHTAIGARKDLYRSVIAWVILPVSGPKIASYARRGRLAITPLSKFAQLGNFPRV